MKVIFSFTWLTLLSIQLNAQELTNSVGQEFLDHLSSQPYYQSEIVFNNSFKGTLGSPYLFDDWQPGFFELENGNRIEGQLLYDIIEDQLILKRAIPLV